jgi:hypothetical protein
MPPFMALKGNATTGRAPRLAAPYLRSAFPNNTGSRAM